MLPVFLWVHVLHQLTTRLYFNIILPGYRQLLVLFADSLKEYLPFTSQKNDV